MVALFGRLTFFFFFFPSPFYSLVNGFLPRNPSMHIIVVKLLLEQEVSGFILSSQALALFFYFGLPYFSFHPLVSTSSRRERGPCLFGIGVFYFLISWWDILRMDITLLMVERRLIIFPPQFLIETSQKWLLYTTASHRYIVTGFGGGRSVGLYDYKDIEIRDNGRAGRRGRWVRRGLRETGGRTRQ